MPSFPYPLTVLTWPNRSASPEKAIGSVVWHAEVGGGQSGADKGVVISIERYKGNGDGICVASNHFEQVDSAWEVAERIDVDIVTDDDEMDMRAGRVAGGAHVGNDLPA